ncbi:MAG: ATP-binding protein [Gammaproteobacteria bacterium]|nr:ATP-binding protein [Gammaproteobacteria bacterium]
MKKPKIQLVPLGTLEQFQEVSLFIDKDNTTLRQLLQQVPALSTKPIPAELMDKPLRTMIIAPVEASAEVPLYRPPGLIFDSARQQSPQTELAPAETSAQVSGETDAAQSTDSEKDAPQARGKLSEKEATQAAYAREIEDIASFLRTDKGLSALVYCDKLIVPHMWPDIVRKAKRQARLLEIPEEDTGGGGLMERSLRQRQLALLKKEIDALKEGQVLVIPHLDLIAGGSENSLSNEAREITEIVYKYTDRLILAFADRSMSIPEVLSARFSVRRLITGVSRTVTDSDGTEKLLGEVFVTQEEAEKFIGFDAANLYKNVAGMNPVHILHAIAYAVKEMAASGPVPVDRLYQAIRAFKVQKSANFEVPDVGFEHIGGYEDVKAIMMKALNLMTGGYQLPDEQLRNELIPRGFIFYGPPGTGKTLFAKAIANKLNATVQVVSGPEVTDMYVGESERKVREIFAEARRNAPSVLVFDEFDAIASKRTGRDDGGSRAGNAVVAQILTEMDGFRPDVPMLVIGTTNQLGLIDEALLRPSRFQAIRINLPDAAARRAIAKVHAGYFKLQQYVSDELLDVLAHATQGFNGDEIRSLFRDACVGLYCETPPRSIDAYSLGELTGNIRRNIEKRIFETSAQAGHTPATPSDTSIPGPSGGMVSLTDDLLCEP